MYRTALLTTAFAILGTAAMADVPRVDTDIAPVQSLVARIMQGVGTPDVILPPGASPHEHAMKPSEARALQTADIVFWVGEGLSPWLETPLASLAGSAEVVELMAVKGTRLLPFRESADFATGAAVAETAGGHDHDHGGMDPHVWMDPQNAITWTGVIARALAEKDPEHADIYAENARAATAELTTLLADMSRQIMAAGPISFVTAHDAFQYFEQRFAIPAAGAISDSDATAPSAARLTQLRDTIAARHINCILAEPEFNSGLIDTVFNGSDVTFEVIDPLGTEFTPGASLYPQMMRSIAQKVTACAG